MGLYVYISLYPYSTFYNHSMSYLRNSYGTLSYEQRPLSFRASSRTVGRFENPKGQAVIQGLYKVINSENSQYMIKEKVLFNLSQNLSRDAS